MIGALGTDGLRALATVEGGTSKPVFLSFVEDHLVPVLSPGDVVVLDNLAAHHGIGVRELIEAAGASILYLPCYSPDLNPIEHGWSKLKQRLKGMGARTVSALRQAVWDAADAITSLDAMHWFCKRLANQLA